MITLLLLAVHIVGAAVSAIEPVATPPADSADRVTLRIDPRHAYVGFAVRHMMIATVKGRFNGVSGTIQLDTSDVERSSVEVTIETATLDSGQPGRDADVRGPDFLDVQRFSTMKFISTRIVRSARGFTAIGDLTIRDVTKQVEIPFSLGGPITRPGGMSIGVDGEFTIDRRDFGMAAQRLMTGGLMVGNDVRIEIQLEAHQVTAPARQTADHGARDHNTRQMMQFATNCCLFVRR